ncbi:MAG: tetratricopeptide repeat protein [Spirochaetaceae bacterium]|nr:tetratricopeptide repeat protein [Spirochaetaceae bacterium]
MKRINFFTFFFFLLVLPVFSQVPLSDEVTYPESYYEFRDAMYNSRGKTASQYETLYNKVISEVEATKSGLEKQVLIARCKYVLGRAYRYIGLNEKAANCFEESINLCKKIFKKTNIPEAYVVAAECISQNCIIQSTTYSLTQGPKIRSYAKKALETDPSYGAAIYLQNSQNIFTPAPFNNYEEGHACLDEMLNTNNFRMDKSDIFNALSAKGYAYLQENKPDEAKIYLQKALEIYPDNQYVLDLLP